MNESINQVEVVPITNLPEVREIEESRSKFLQIALSTKVSDRSTLEIANQLFLEADDRVKAIDNKLDKNRKRAYESYQDWLKLIKELKEPYLKGKAYLNSQIVDYKKETDRLRAEEEEKNRLEAIRIEAERRQKEEDDKLAQAAELEAAGAHEEAEALVSGAIEEKEKPLEPYIPPPETPKVELQGATVRTNWSAEVIDLRVLCRAVGDGKCPLSYIEANMTILNAQARALKKEMAIPGVKAVSTSGLAATGRK